MLEQGSGRGGMAEKLLEHISPFWSESFCSRGLHWQQGNYKRLGHVTTDNRKERVWRMEKGTDVSSSKWHVFWGVQGII